MSGNLRLHLAFKIARSIIYPCIKRTVSCIVLDWGVCSVIKVSFFFFYVYILDDVFAFLDACLSACVLVSVCVRILVSVCVRVCIGKCMCMLVYIGKCMSMCAYIGKCMRMWMHMIVYR